MAFTGRAIYDPGVFDTLAEDVSDIVSMISPAETPLLDAMAQAPRPATNVLHEWLEDVLSPNTVVASSDVASNVTGGDAIGIAGGAAGFLQVGVILESPVTVSGEREKLRVTAISGDTITVARAQGGSLANSFAAGQAIFVISDAALEGADVVDDTSIARTRLNNYVQIFKKDIIISGTSRAVRNLGNISDEWTYQIAKKTRESVRDLEKAVIRGVTLGNTIGTASVQRTFRGVRASIVTNVMSIGTLTESWLGNLTQKTWEAGGVDVDILVSGVNDKRNIDSFNTANRQTFNTDRGVVVVVDTYENAFGSYRSMINRWMPVNETLVLASRRISVPPLQGRNYAFLGVGKTGDSDKGMVIGEYSVEVRNENGLGRKY